MHRHHPRRHAGRTAAALAAGLALLLVLLSAGCGDGAGGPSASQGPPTVTPTDPGLSPEPVPSGSGQDGPAAPAAGKPMVYLLGGSSARECIVGNADWAAEMQALGAGEVEAVDLGDTNRTFSQDLAYVREMDPSRPTVVLIGVNLGRFTQAPSPTLANKPLTRDERAGIAGTIDLRHRYTASKILSDAEKRAMVDKWLDERRPLFDKNHVRNREMLLQLVLEAQERGLSPVLLDLPLNLEIAEGRLDESRDVYLADSRAVAEKTGIPLLAFVDEVGLRNGEFYDVAHLVEPGREKWQTRLSREVVKLLRAEGLAPD